MFQAEIPVQRAGVMLLDDEGVPVDAGTGSPPPAPAPGCGSDLAWPGMAPLSGRWGW